MKRLTPTEKIALLAPAAAVLRATDSTISYRDFARVIGMTTADDGWMPASRFWLGELLPCSARSTARTVCPTTASSPPRRASPATGSPRQLRKERAA